MSDSGSELANIHEILGGKIIESMQAQGDDIVILDRAGLRESFRLLKEQ